MISQPSLDSLPGGSTLKRAAKAVLTPNGRGGWRDRVVLGLWDGRALAHRLWLARDLSGLGGSPRPAGPAGATGNGERRYDGPFFRRQVLSHVLPFWRRHAVDPEGGFLVHLDRWGAVYDPRYKHPAMQARVVYSFAIGHRLDPDGGYRELAEHGVRFLLEQCWDPVHGGFFRSVTRAGHPQDPIKHAFTQAYVLIGLLAWLEITDDPGCRERVGETFALLEQWVWDREYGGYREIGERDWAVREARKTVCIQLDLLAAWLDFERLEPSGSARARIRSLADILRGRMRDPRRGCLLETFHRDWRYDPIPMRDSLFVGHNLKAAWLLCEVFERTRAPAYLRAAEELVDFCLRWGWDARHGGFFHPVYRLGPPRQTEKVWWTQAEGVMALYRLHELTGRPRYRRAADRALDFALEHFQDTEAGGWLYATHADGRPRDVRKGADYKAAFHETQVWWEAYRYAERRAVAPAESAAGGRS